jgi:hypothetical protein
MRTASEGLLFSVGVVMMDYPLEIGDYRPAAFVTNEIYQLSTRVP